MVFTTEDRILIKSLYLLGGYNVTRLLAEFPEKNWKRHELKNCFVLLSSVVDKNNVICANYNFTRYRSYTFRI
jgi:hypothetical protein